MFFVAFIGKVDRRSAIDRDPILRASKRALEGDSASRELHRLYDRWFVEPIPPHNVRLDMRMPHLLSDSLKYPSDFVPK